MFAQHKTPPHSPGLATPTWGNPRLSLPQKADYVKLGTSESKRQPDDRQVARAARPWTSSSGQHRDAQRPVKPTFCSTCRARESRPNRSPRGRNCSDQEPVCSSESDPVIGCQLAQPATAAIMATTPNTTPLRSCLTTPFLCRQETWPQWTSRTDTDLARRLAKSSASVQTTPPTSEIEK